MKVELTQVTRRFHTRRGVVTALDSVSLTLSDGEWVIVRGPSGCGKTTLLLTVGGLRRPDGGEVKVGSHDLYREMCSEERVAYRSKAVGFVFQQFHLIPYLTVLENVLSPAIVCPVVEGEKRAREWLERLGLGDRLDHKPSELSTGERQRAALARALFHGPELLLADEPTGNLDEQLAGVAMELCEILVRKGGTVLMASHDERAFRRAHRVLKMECGRFVS